MNVTILTVKIREVTIFDKIIVPNFVKIPLLSIYPFFGVFIEGLTSPVALEIECLPSNWEVIGSSPGRIPAVIYCQSPC